MCPRQNANQLKEKKEDSFVSTSNDYFFIWHEYWLNCHSLVIELMLLQCTYILEIMYIYIYIYMHSEYVCKQIIINIKH